MTTDKTTQVDGLTIRYRDTGGDGLPVLLSSGIGGSLELWQKQLDALGGQHRLISWDYPGHGLSDPWRHTFEPGGLAEFALRFLDALGVERAVLAGNSLGGAIAIRMAAAAPARVAGLVLVAPALVVPEVFLPFRLMTLPLLGPLMTKPSEKGVALALDSMFHITETVTDDIRAVMRRNQFKEGGAQAFRATLCEMMTIRGIKPAFWKPLQEMVAALSCPVLNIHGRQDKVLPVAQAETIQALIPNGELLILDPCGHTAQWEAPEEVNRAISRFLEGLA